MSSEVIRPWVFMVHDVEHGNYGKITDQLDLPDTYLLNSYTDLYPEENAHNNLDEIKNKVFFSGDYLVVQDSLLKLGSKIVRELFSTSLLSSVARTEYYQFDSDYNVVQIEFEDVCEYVGLFTGDISEIGENVMEKTQSNDSINRYQKVVAEEAAALVGADIFINEVDDTDDLGRLAISKAVISEVTQEGEKL